MKTAGILLLFGLCTAIGLRAANRKAERYRRICALLSQLRLFSDGIETRQSSLKSIVKDADGELFDMLRVYLNARDEKKSETQASEQATEEWIGVDTAYPALVAFFEGLSICSSASLRKRTEALMHSLQLVETELHDTVRQAKTIRTVGVLIGAGICILLL